jgi:flagellar biosynthetic protein FliQ
LAMALFGGWQINTLVEFTRVIFQRIPTLFL